MNFFSLSLFCVCVGGLWIRKIYQTQHKNLDVCRHTRFFFIIIRILVTFFNFFKNISLEYVAPEVITSMGHDQSVDVWSLG